MAEGYYNAMDNETYSDYGIPANSIGVTTAPMKDQLDELKAKIRAGFSKIELGFSGAGKGFGERLTPGSYGSEEREALRELSKVNDIELTTHASFNIGPVSGIGERGYSDEQRKASVDEIKRAVDFAAEVAEGGAVVLHTGEFQRPIMEAGLSEEERKQIRFGEKKALFEEHEDAINKAMVSVINKETGQFEMNGYIDMDRDFYEPKMKRLNGDLVVDPHTEPGDDEYGHHEPGDPKMDKYSWKDILERAHKHNAVKREEGMPDRDLTPAEFFHVKQMNDKLLQLRGNISYYKQIAQGRDDIGIIQSIAQMTGEARKMEDQIRRGDIIDTQKYALEKASKSLADLGMHAIAQQEKRERETGKKFKRDLYIAPENVFPESYGAHPEELTRIIKEGRKALKQELMHKRHLDEKEAERMAKNHLKATIDVGHAYLWKRFFKGDDKQFKDWYVKQIEQLQKEDVIGHLHVSDNFGYYDEHLTPGHGTVPIKEMVEKLKKSNVDVIVETGRQGESAFTGAFKEFGSPVYGMSQPSSYDPWDVIENSYFGRTAPPYFVVGEISQQMGERVSKDFSSFAGVPFE